MTLSSLKRHSLIDYEGKSIRVYDDARTALTIIDLFSDETISIDLKYDILMKLLFVNPHGVVDGIADIQGLLVLAVEKVCALDITGGNPTEEKVIDWAKDSQYIKASMWQTYGKSLDEISEAVTLPELGSMIALCPRETPIGQAIYYRTAQPPKPTKYNSEEIKDFRERQRFWALSENRMNDEAAAMARAWRNGGN